MRCAILLVLLFFATPALADVPGLTVSLAGGEVAGHTRGLGTATVTAQVSNNSGRTLDGIRLAAFYSPTDVLPSADVDWRIHEFVFEPPLAAGTTTTLQFSDDNAAQYVLLDARAAKFRAALRYGSVTRDLQFPLLKRNGTAFVALRDLAAALDARLTNRAGYITLERSDSTVKVKPLSAQAQVDGQSRTLANALLEDQGRSYIGLRDAAQLFGLEVSDLGSDLFELK